MRLLGVEEGGKTAKVVGGPAGCGGSHLPFLAFWHSLESETENLMCKGGYSPEMIPRALGALFAVRSSISFANLCTKFPVL